MWCTHMWQQWSVFPKAAPCQQKALFVELVNTKSVASTDVQWGALLWVLSSVLCSWTLSSNLCMASPCTTSRPSAVRLILVPGRLAAHTYTPECCRETSEIIRFPVPRTWIPSTPMERPSEGQRDMQRSFVKLTLETFMLLTNLPPNVYIISAFSSGT